MQRWLDDSDLDRIMQNYDANNDGEPPSSRDTSSIESQNSLADSMWLMSLKEHSQ